MMQKEELVTEIDDKERETGGGESTEQSGAEQNRQPEEPVMELMGFRLGQEEYAVDIMALQEITPVFELTPIPRAPDYVLGILSLRGTIIPIFDPKRRIGLPETGRTDKARIIVLRSGEDEVGLLVDSITSAARVPLRSIEPTPPVIKGIEADYINGVGKVGERVIIIMNMDAIIHIVGMQ
ncbi:MAG: chemotaxis protein CheW [bacterium]|nr:chemotaxis protein CheW [bacterium]